MASRPDVITVFQCPCGSYIPEADKLYSHHDVCSSLQKEVAAISSANLTYNELQDAVGNVTNFYLPRVIINKLREPIQNSTLISSLQHDKLGIVSSSNDCDIDIRNDDVGETTLRPRRSGLRTKLTSTKTNSVKRSYVDADDMTSDWEYDSSDSDVDECEPEVSLKSSLQKKQNIRKRLKISSRKTTVVGKKTKCESGDVADRLYIYKCDKCPAKFRTDKTFEWHMFYIHGDGSKNHEIITCALCQRMFNKRLVYLSHLKNHENAEALEEAFDLWNRWPEKSQEGSRAAKMILKFNCKYCLIPHTSHNSFLKHMETEHPEKGRFAKFSCPYCETSEFGSIKHFIVHIRTVHTKEHYGRTIKWPSSHPNEASRPKGQCDICMKMLDVWYLKAHKEKLHSNRGKTRNSQDKDYMYTCLVPNCYSRFKKRELLKSHFILHLENNPFVCKFPGCTVKCDAQCHLDRHMKLHLSQPLKCSKCGVHYSRIDKLKSHVCTFDQSKLAYDEHGRLRSVNGRSRLQRVNKDEYDITTTNDDTNLIFGENSKSEISTSEKELIETNHKGAYKKHKKRININVLISADPVFVNVCKDNPGFKELILGTKRRRPLKNEEKAPATKRIRKRVKKAIHKKDNICKPEISFKCRSAKIPPKKKGSVKKASTKKTVDTPCKRGSILNSSEVAYPVLKVEIESELIIEDDADTFSHMVSSEIKSESESFIKTEPSY